MATPQVSLNNQWARRERRMRIRIAVVAGGVLLGFAAIVVRDVQLQVQDNHALEWVAEKQYQAIVPVAARRGKILDARGKELAVSQAAASIYMDGRMVSDPISTLRQLASVLNLDANLMGDLRSQLFAHKRFIWVKRKVGSDVVEKIKALAIPGVRVVEESRRMYPSGKLASTVLGAAGMDSEGLAGVEMAYNESLLSKHNSMTFQRDARGRLIYSPVAFKDQVDVGSVMLTIDKTIQFIVESALDRAVESSKSKAGVAVVMDPKTGAILAMAASPNFNPNDYTQYPQSMWRNRAITDTFEPGSTFKVLTVATALDQGLVTPEQKFDCMRGAVTIGNATIHDHDPYGILTVRDIIKVSSNIGAYKVAHVVGKDRLYESLRRFGIGQKTGVEIPGEVNGVMRPSAKWGPVELATIAFGQGVTATPLQLTSAMATIANRGVRMKPFVVQRVENAAGEVVFEATPTTIETAIRPETATLMLDIMRGVVGQGGTAKKAASEEFSVAGKTGTAQKVMEGSGKYAAGKFFASFVGVAPVEDPRLAIFVGVDEPQVGHFGGQIAGPVFREIAEAALHYMTVPGKSTSVMVKAEEPQAENLPHPLFSKEGSNSSSPPLKKGGRGDLQVAEITLPDMSGWPMRRVVAMLQTVDARVELEGGGRLVSQMPTAGAVVRKGDRVQVKFSLPE